jgi:sterol desaturase/sphingolipid hydroxylase (fatty acid hydroxylase superfamily)
MRTFTRRNLRAEMNAPPLPESDAAPSRISRLIDSAIENRANYWAGFVTDAALFVVFVGLALYDVPSRGGLPATCAAAFAGWFSWGLVEYAIHRWVFHARVSPAYPSHLRHHREPEALLALPFFVNAGAMLGAWFLLRLVVPIGPASGFCAGLEIGALYYGVLHTFEHHSAINAITSKRLRRSWAYHRIHHKLPNANYGVTTSFWDRVFGTHYQAQKKRSSLA